MSAPAIPSPRTARAKDLLVPLTILLLLLVPRVSAEAQVRMLDDFESLSGWTAHPSDGVTLHISQDQGWRGRGMRLDFDFHGGGGYAIARKAIDLPLPENYEFNFHLRGSAPPNNLEFKLIDSTGDNVWWSNQRNFEFPTEWEVVTRKKRHISFAWGPRGGGELEHVAAIEIVVTAGSGGKGTVWIDQLTFEPREPVRPYDLVPDVAVSSAAAGHAGRLAIDGDSATAWRSTSGGEAWLTLDFLRNREYGGLVIDWAPAAHAADYTVETSPDGARWTTAYTVRGGDGGRDYLYLPETESRYLRLRTARSGSSGYGIRELEVKPIEWSATRSAFFHAVAREAPRGSYPKYLADSVQSYWTVIGVDGGANEALINEEGMIETGKLGPSIEPFLYTGGRLITWADADQHQWLEGGYLPIPSVEWGAGDLRLTVTAWATGEPGAASAVVRYRVANRGGEPLGTTLYLALRPFQVNPTWQFLNAPGGAARVRTIAFDSVLRADEHRVVPLTPPAGFGAITFDGGGIVSQLRRGALPPHDHITDSLEAASAALAYSLELGAGEVRDVYLAVPLDSSAVVPPEARASADAAARYAERTLAESREEWTAALSRTSIDLPRSASAMARTIRTVTAHILINRDGPAIQPGSRSYDRSWIRDGSLTSTALLRLGHDAEVREFIEWFAGYQYPSGKVPCCVDQRGAAPVPENDSHGQLIYVIAEYYRHTGDRSLLERMWPHVQAAVGYIDWLRHQRMTEEYRTPERRAFYGLLPESISHEGYSAKPMHSYWDDFFALRGLKDAVTIAAVLGRDEARARFAAIRDEFERDLYHSLDLAMAAHGIEYIPGSVELGDFDATSTTTAVAPGGEQAALPPDALRHTFERYYRSAAARPDSTGWDAYTPYELRTVGTFVRLGQAGRAHELLRQFMGDRRPARWNQWAEVVWRDPATPRFIGDMPHTWVGSDYIRSVLDMFAYAREADSALVVGAGVPDAWVREDSGVTVRRLSTHYGDLDLSMRAADGGVRIRIGGPMMVPPGGVVVRAPFPRRVESATADGRPVEVQNGSEVLVRRLPAVVVLRYADAGEELGGARWWKGNTHTHSLWSDGDGYPEMIADWYREHGYDFLVLTDHNVPSREKWITVGHRPERMQAYREYEERFGADWVDDRMRSDTLQVRLRRHSEYRALLERPGEFLLLPGEEITEYSGDRAAHLNAINLARPLEPRGGTSVVEMLRNNLAAVAEQRAATGRPMIATINHPNYLWSLTAADLATLEGARFFELYNGHPLVHNAGDSAHVGTERMWDRALIARLTHGGGPLYAVASDDAHDYHAHGSDRRNPGRGWVMVRAERLTAESIVGAMRRGDFYASTGVELSDVGSDGGRISLKIRSEPGVSYVTRFVGARNGRREVLAEVEGTSPSYTVQGDELYVRATVISSRPKAKAPTEGEAEMAWVQPFVVDGTDGTDGRR